MSAYSDLILSRSPVAYWRLGEPPGTAGAGSILDASGNGRHATPLPGLTYGQAGALAGDSDTAILFTASAATGIERVGDAVLNGLPLSGAFSVDFWARPTALAVSACVLCFQGPDDFNVYPADGTGRVRVFWRDAGGSVATPGVSGLVGVWHHYAVTWDSSRIRVYVDGAIVGTSAVLSTGTIGPFSSFGLGMFESGQRFGGHLDEVAVYSTTLSDTQVAEHYALGVTGPSTPAATPRGVLLATAL